MQFKGGRDLRKNKRVKSIFQKVFVPIICVMILQSCVFYYSSVWGGMTDLLNNNAKDSLTNCVSDRERDFEKLFNERWSNVEIYADAFDQLYEKYEKESPVPMYENDKMQEEYLNDISTILISMIRNNEINGAYLILNDNKNYVSLEEEKVQHKNGLCIRDYDQNSGYTEIEDLRLLRCPNYMTAYMNCPLEISWEPFYTFNSKEKGNYYFKPLKNAYENVNASRKEMAYFSDVYKFEGTDASVISYSIPLITSAGFPYGVLGVELTTDYLSSLLPYEELGNKEESSYVLVQYKEDDKFDILTYSGEYLREQFDIKKGINVELFQSDNLFLAKGKSGVKLCGSISELVTYNNEAVNSENNIALIGIVSEENLFYFQKIIYRNMLMVTFVVLVIGMIAIYFVSRYFSKPITALAEKVRTMEPEPNFELDRLGIAEIDQLVTSIEDMSRNISESKARTEFFSRMSHDMRTPMNAIISFSSPHLLENVKTKDEYLQKINLSGSYLLGLINEVLDMTKIDSGKMELHEENMSLKKFWSANGTIIEKLAEEKNIEFKMNLAKSGIDYIVADYIFKQVS